MDHLVGGNLIVAALLAGHARPDADADHLGEGPLGAYHAAVAVRAAFGQPGALERTYQGPFEPAPCTALLERRIANTPVHGWDVAQATGQGADLPDELAMRALAFSRDQLTTADRGSWFSPPQDVAEDAPAIDGLVAYLGRTVPPAKEDHGR